MKCVMSKVECKKCQHYGDCQILNDFYVMQHELKSFIKKVEDVRLIAQSIASKR